MEERKRGESPTHLLLPLLFSMKPTTRIVSVLLLAPLFCLSRAFAPYQHHAGCAAAVLRSLPRHVTPSLSFSRTQQYMSAADDTTIMAATEPSSSSSPPSTSTSIPPKEAVKLFGRLAEKYILLDSSGGMCSYSACSDCEFRLPGGGYRMADQSAARPKWIPSYEARTKADGTTVESKWSVELFIDGKPALSKQDFVERLQALSYAPPLGGPYVGASAASIEDTAAAECLWDLLLMSKKEDEESDGNNSKQVLTKHRMSLRLKELTGGEQGLTWAGFSKALLGE